MPTIYYASINTFINSYCLQNKMILGIWDGHDAGACIVSGNKILVAINEERITKRKLDVGFPKGSIKACMDYINVKPSDISAVTASTSDFSKTLTRAFPSLKESYYNFRRRKTQMPLLHELRRKIKYNSTEIPPTLITKKLSEHIIKKQLSNLGFKQPLLYIIGHHLSHASSCAFTLPSNNNPLPITPIPAKIFLQFILILFRGFINIFYF